MCFPRLGGGTPSELRMGARIREIRRARCLAHLRARREDTSCYFKLLLSAKAGVRKSRVGAEERMTKSAGEGAWSVSLSSDGWIRGRNE